LSTESYSKALIIYTDKLFVPNLKKDIK